MHERTVEIATADGRMPTFVTRPESDERCPAILIYMDALGIREELKDMARRLGTVGYHVLLPNLFYRDGGPSFDPARLPTQGPDPEMMRLNLALSHAQVLADSRALLDFLHHELTVSRGAMAAIGYCMGGRHALAAAGTFPSRIKAMASLHGGHQVTERPDSAHLLIPRIKAECYFGFAADDPLTPPEHQQLIAEAHARQGIPHQIEVHAGTQHGFTFPERHCYHKAAAERVWERLFALLRRRLG
jgi:carboxymethylenebutenolidase